MFTGIIEEVGNVLEVFTSEKSLTLCIDSTFVDLKLGESISVDGACLTVTQIKNSSFTVEISPETLQLTNLNECKMGKKLNLERALKLGDRLGGHFVLGHVDGKAEVVEKKEYFEYLELGFSCKLPESQCYLAHKGSVAVNGVSLTVNETYQTFFKVMLIPHTLDHTNLSFLKVGDEVNIEFDSMLKTIVTETRKALKSL